MHPARDDLLQYSSWAECRRQLALTPLVGAKPFALQVEGRRYIAKPGSTRGYGWFRIGLIALGVWLVAGSLPAAEPLRRAGPVRVAHEIHRLDRLREEEVPVPEVSLRLDNLLVLEYVGRDLASLLPELSSGEREDMVRALGHDMAAFHRRGHWHGAAQLRNMTWHEGRIYRIDFEEDLEGVLPLPMIQALDVLLAVFSVAHHRSLGEPEKRHRLGLILVRSWAEAVDSSASTQALETSAAWLMRLDWLAGAFRWVPSRDLRAFRLAIEILRSGLR